MEEARRHAEEHGFKLGSGNKWWRLFKARNTDVVSRTPSLVESQRADSRLDEDQWRDFFAEASKALAEVDYGGQYIANIDETSFHQNFITRVAARKVYSIRGRRSVRRRQGYQRKVVTVIAAMVASRKALPPTLLFDTKTVKGSHLRYCDREIILKGTGIGWSSSEIFVELVEPVKRKHPKGCIFKTLVRSLVVCFAKSFAPKSQILISKNSWTTHNTEDGATQ